MSRGVIFDDVTDTSGNALPGISVTIFEEGTTTKATLYDARVGGNNLDNPLTTNDRGIFLAYLEPGSYDISVAAPTGTFVKPGVPALDPDDVNDLNDNIADINAALDLLGDTGALNALQTVGTLAELRALSGLSDGKVVETASYIADKGAGGAVYRWDETKDKSGHNGISVHSPTVPWDGTSAALEDYLDGVGETDPSGSGCWVLSQDVVVTPRHAGAVDGESAQEVPIEKYFLWCGDPDGQYRLAHDGDYYVSRGIRIESCSNANFLASSHLIIRPPTGQYIDEDGLRLFDCDNGTWGRIQVLGDSSGGGFRNGVVAQRIRRGQFEQLAGNYHRLFGVVITSDTDGDEPAGFSANNNGAIVDKIDAAYCGDRLGIGISFSETSRNYAANNPGQTSTLSIDLDDYYPTWARGTPFVYDGDAYVVLSYDDVAQEAVVYPCLAADPDPMVSGTLTLLPGGGLLTTGGDAGQLRTEQVNIRFSSTGLSLQSAYGGSIKGLTSQFNGIDVVHGRPPSSFSNAGETLYNVYSENSEFLNVLSLTDSNSYIDIIGTIEEFSNNQVLVPLPDIREKTGDGPVRFIGSSGVTGTRPFSGVPAATTWRRGTPGTPTNIFGAGSEAFANPGGTIILSPDNTSRDFSFNLGVDNTNTRAFGPSAVALVCIGFATGNEITLTAPAGETVEGASSYVVVPPYEDFWIICGRVTPTTWRVRLMPFPDLGQWAAFSGGTTGGAGSAGSGNQYVELEIGGTTYKVLHDGTV